MNETTIIGLLLTLVGLLASFFWVSLGAWLRDLVALRSEAQYWQPIDTADGAKERALIRAKVAGLGDWTTGFTALVVLGFGAFLLSRALILAYRINNDLATTLKPALWLFLGILVALTLFLLTRGYLLAHRIKQAADVPLHD